MKKPLPRMITPSATYNNVFANSTIISVGNSSVASISAGVFYVVNGYNQVVASDGTTTKYSIGNFVNVNPQTVILDKYDNTPSLRVGLNIVENTLVINKRKKSDIENDMDKIENILRKDESFDYLLNMNILSLTEERMEKLLSDIKTKKESLDKLKNTR